MVVPVLGVQSKFYLQFYQLSISLVQSLFIDSIIGLSINTTPSKIFFLPTQLLALLYKKSWAINTILDVTGFI